MRAWPVVLIALAGLVAYLWTTTRPPSPSQFPNLDAALSMYNDIKQEESSRIGSEEFQRIIQERVLCYNNVTSPLQRNRPCNITYVDEIVRTARVNFQSAPQLGLFIREVQYCPIAYSMCVGENMDMETCITFERKCIDLSLDKYWRGFPLNEARE
jgi:hypothetical protein